MAIKIGGSTVINDSKEFIPVTISAGGTAGTSGQVLKSTGVGIAWTDSSSGGGGSGKFDNTINNTLYYQTTGTLDVVGVGTTTSRITTIPSTANTRYIIHSIHATNISNGDAEITVAFDDSADTVTKTLSAGGSGIHTCIVSSNTGIVIGMALTGTNVDYNTFVTDVYGTIITLSKPLVGTASGTGYFTPVSRCASRLPVPVGSAVEILKQPFVLNPNDNIRVASTGVGTGGLVASTTASGTIGSSRVTVASATNIEAGNLVSGTGIATNTYVGVGYTPASTSVPLTRALTSTIASSVISFTDIVIPQDGALATTIVYQSQPDSSGSIYQNAVGTLTTTFTNYYSAGTTYSAIIQSIRVTNISDSSIYPANDYPVWVGIGNSDTIFTYLAYNMVVPKNSSIELCEAPKRLGIGQSIFAYSQTPGVVEIQIAGRQSTV